MHYLDLAFPTPAENLACEEALLAACDQGGPEVLRVWEPASTFVVVGYANRVASEVDLAACEDLGIPILRRTSGGGTVVQAPGCLNYALVLRLDKEPWRHGIASTNRNVLERIAGALRPLLGTEPRVAGDTDLALGARKFAGNAQRRLQHALLFHGSILLNADLDWIERLLPLPSRQPAYRSSRPHRDLLVNLDLPVAAVKDALRHAWDVAHALEEWPQAQLKALVREKYANAAWNLKF